MFSTELQQRLLVDIKDCENWEKNPRSISEANLDRLVESISNDPSFLSVNTPFGYQDPETKKYIILGGNQRLNACKKLKYKKFPLVVCKDLIIDGKLNEELASKRCLTDNIEYGEYDFDIMANSFVLSDLEPFASLEPSLDFALSLLSGDEELEHVEVDENETAKDLETYLNGDEVKLTLSYSSEDFVKVVDTIKEIKSKVEIVDNLHLLNKVIDLYLTNHNL